MKNVDHYKSIHESSPEYGAGSRHFYFVLPILSFLRTKSIVDFGCGKGVLADQIDDLEHFECDKYDPAIPQYDQIPTNTYDCLVNTDVLEHIPEDELHETLKYFPRLSDNAIVIPHLRKAAQILPSGENAHCTLKSPEEWRGVLRNYYQSVELLPHESDRHALLLCMQHHTDIQPLVPALSLIAEMTNDRALVHSRLTDSFSRRARRAAKLILGTRAIR